MNKDQKIIEAVRKIARGERIDEISDDLNPKYLFQDVEVPLLLKVAFKKIDTVMLAKKELVGEGVDKKGKHVGIQKAQEIWGVEL